MDQVTAYADLETECKFQKRVKEHFGDFDLIIIVHCIEAALDCDKIAIFDAGEAVEEGSVNRLILYQDKTIN